MAFFLIVPSVIIVSIFLVHAIAERLNFKIKYSSLILCAVMSFAVNFAAINLSDYLDRWHYIRLGGLILFAAVIVTAINKFLVSKEKNIAQNEESSKPAETTLNENTEETLNPIAIKQTDNVSENKKFDINKSTIIKNIEKPETKIASNLVDSKSNINLNDTKKTNKTVTPNKLVVSDKSNTSTQPTAPAKLVETDKPTISDKSANFSTTTAKSTISDKTNNIDKQPIDKSTEIKKPIVPVQAEKNNITDTDKKMSSPKIKVIEESPNDDTIKNSSETNKKVEIIDEIDAHLGSLDDILDYAYAEKANGNMRQAILAYQKALDRYQNDDYAPFIAIDLGNIYKEQAAYTKVIKTYEEALKLPVVTRNLATYNEFAKNLSYMRMVQTVLARHRALATPFSKIPAQYLREVETELKAAQMRTKYK